MKKLLIILLFPFQLSAQCLEMDIILLGDMSKSIYGYESLLYSALDSFSKRFDLDENGVRIGVIVFNDNATKIHGLTGSDESLEKSLEYVGVPDGGTYMNNAFNMARLEFMENGRIGVNKLVILISDGEPANPATTELAVSELLSLDKMIICGVFVKKSNSIWSKTSDIYAYWMKSITTDCFVVTNYHELINDLEELNVCF